MPTTQNEYDLAKVDYEQSLATYRQLVEIRFKLLALVPTLSGIGVGILSEADIADPVQFVLALWGLLVTFGIVLYDRRNTQFHDGAIGRIEHLEAQLGMPKFETDVYPGLFGSRNDQPRLRLFGVLVWHDLGLALVYSSALGAWAYAAVDALQVDAPVAALTGAAILALSMMELLGWRRRRKPPARSTEPPGGLGA